MNSPLVYTLRILGTLVLALVGAVLIWNFFGDVWAMALVMLKSLKFWLFFVGWVCIMFAIPLFPGFKPPRR